MVSGYIIGMKSDDVFHFPSERAFYFQLSYFQTGLSACSCSPSSSSHPNNRGSSYVIQTQCKHPFRAVTPSTGRETFNPSCAPLQTISAEANWKVTLRPSEKASIHGHDCASSKRHFQPRFPEPVKPAMFGQPIGPSRFSLASRCMVTKSRGHKKVQIIFTFYLTTPIRI